MGVLKGVVEECDVHRGLLLGHWISRVKRTLDSSLRMHGHVNNWEFVVSEITWRVANAKMLMPRLRCLVGIAPWLRE